MTEALLAEQVANYIRAIYPAVVFHFDFGSGLRMTMGQASKQRRLNRRAFPDLVIYEPRHGKHGLAIELKRETTRVWLALIPSLQVIVINR